MRKALISTMTLSSAAALVLSGAPALAAHEQGLAGTLTAAGLSAGGTKVSTFALSDGEAAKAVKLTGLSGDSRLVGLDYRVFGGDDTLYGVGDQGGLYAVDPTTGVTSKAGQLSVALEGTSFGVDFNPAANALRVISDTGQNLRQPFPTLVDDVPGNAATAVDGSLNYGGTVTGAASSTGGAPALGVTGAAYLNNDADATTGTALYDLDTTRDALAVQNANPGVLTQVGSGLGVGDVSEVAGFDIVTDLAADGTTVRNAAYAVLTVAGERGIFVVNTTTGAATRISGLTRGVTDIAVAPPA